jgi:hypothetical protein
MQHQTSSIQYPVSSIEQPAASTETPSSNNLCSIRLIGDCQ